LRLSILAPAAWAASIACQAPPPSSLPDPVAFVQERFDELDLIAQRMWTEIYAVWEQDENFGRGGAWFKETPAMQEMWAEIQSVLRPHLDPELARAYAIEDIDQPERMHLLLMLEKAPVPTRRTLRLAATDDTGSQRTAAVEVVDLAVPEDWRLRKVDWIWLRESQGRWVFAGVGLVDPTATNDLPRAQRARPYLRMMEWNPPLVLSWISPQHGGGERLLAADFRPWWPKRDPESDLHGADRIARELALTLAKLRDLSPGETRILCIEPPADLPLSDLRILLGPASDSGFEPWDLALHVWLDGIRRPGELRFEQRSTDPAAPTVAAGAAADSWPEALRAGPSPPMVGIHLTPHRTVQDLCTTADALLARGVTTLFLAEPGAAAPR
jgi:hypothetical protein